MSSKPKRGWLKTLLSQRRGRVIVGVTLACAALVIQMTYKQAVRYAYEPLGPALPPYPTLIAAPVPGSVASVTLPPPPPANLETVCDAPPQMLVLAIGADTDQGDFTHGLADVIRVVRIDFVTPSVHVLSIPRDMWVVMPGTDAYLPRDYFGSPLDENGQTIDTPVNAGRINSAYFYGNLYGLSGGGPGTLAQTVYYNLGLPVDHYVAIDMALLTDVVDELGGIDVIVQTPTSEFPAGLVHMDGATAVLYARQRGEDTDFHRSRRQNEIMLALRTELLKPAVLPHIPGLIDSFIDRTLTDMSRSQFALFTCLLTKVDEEHIDTHAITPDMMTETFTDKGSYVLLPDYEAISGVIQAFLDHNYPSGE